MERKSGGVSGRERKRKEETGARVAMAAAPRIAAQQQFRRQWDEEEGSPAYHYVPVADFATCPAGGSGAPYLPVGKSRFGPMATAYRSDNGVVPLEYGPCSRVIGEVQGRWGPQCIGAFPSEYVSESDVSLGCVLSASGERGKAAHPLAAVAAAPGDSQYYSSYGFYKGPPGGNEPVAVNGGGSRGVVFSAPTSSLSPPAGSCSPW